jgi:hypothetical protein
MREVPPRIAGSASGILNTTRNIGQLLGIAVLGSVLQNRVGVHVAERMEDSAIETSLAGRVVAFARQSQFERLREVVPSDAFDVVFGLVQSGFIDALRNTFTVGALTCALAAVVALLIRNPKRSPATVAASAPAAAQATAD